MKYSLTEPCDACPFLLGSGFTYESLMDHAAGEFACHKTCELDDDTGDYEPREKSLHCAGALIFLEKQGAPHQMMRICERLRDKNGELFYDARKLNMDAPVGCAREDYGHRKRRKKNE